MKPNRNRARDLGFYVLLLVIIVESQFDYLKKLRQELLAAKREAGKSI